MKIGELSLTYCLAEFVTASGGIGLARSLPPLPRFYILIHSTAL